MKKRGVYDIIKKTERDADMEYIKEINKVIKQNEHMLNLLRFYRGIDRSEISRRLQISMPTVYKAIDELSNQNIIIKSDNSIFINDEYAYLIGVSIGSALCKISFLDLSFNMLDTQKFANYKGDICEKIEDNIADKELLRKCMNDDSKNYIYFKTPTQFSELKNILNCIFEFIQASIEKHLFKVLSIGISCTGVINNKTQTILSAHNLDYLDNSTLDTLIFPDKQRFFNDSQIYVCLVQNSNASVVAEKIHLYQTNSPYKSKKNVVALYLGVGIGAGIYLNGLYSGASGYSGEIGHTKAPMYETKYLDKKDNGSNILDKSCTCGNEDCYDFKMRTYVFRMNKEAFSVFSADQIRDYLKDGDNQDKAELFGKYLGNMVNSLTNLLNIDLIIFTGKFYKCMDSLYNSIVSVQDQNKLKFSRNDCTLLTSTYGSLAPSVGAAIYSYHKRFDLELTWNYE